ncbi:UpxY family transcription antiterminator [Arcticibacter tournemirensis]|uniref:UpxY family transcription antiterminator n=1 Tax=Arcticibacter tournemirensis TaxID=699437 RepID=A0A4Q0M8E0_9SPHI|nr:UpxY family transcription antiterminator [Arcticibacter tournemirensis]RXF69410.1 UpxY family transcription antiterminator [Arcticibacter tournemirensis]
MSYLNSDPLYKWYAVYTKSRTEKKVHTELTRKGIEAYLPLVREQKRWSDRMKIVEEPFLPGYVLVRVSFREQYDVLVIPGALRYISFEGTPAPIPDYQIENLKIFMVAGDHSIEVTSERIHKGDKIRVISGPLANVNGEVVEIRGKRRILLRFDTLGYCIHAEIGINKIDLLEENQDLQPAHSYVRSH